MCHLVNFRRKFGAKDNKNSIVQTHPILGHLSAVFVFNISIKYLAFPQSNTVVSKQQPQCVIFVFKNKSKRLGRQVMKTKRKRSIIKNTPNYF